jgi:hypothetical protein
MVAGMEGIFLTLRERFDNHLKALMKKGYKVESLYHFTYTQCIHFIVTKDGKYLEYDEV